MVLIAQGCSWLCSSPTQLWVHKEGTQQGQLTTADHRGIPCGVLLSLKSWASFRNGRRMFGGMMLVFPTLPTIRDRVWISCGGLATCPPMRNGDWVPYFFCLLTEFLICLLNSINLHLSPWVLSVLPFHISPPSEQAAVGCVVAFWFKPWHSPNLPAMGREVSSQAHLVKERMWRCI